MGGEAKTRFASVTFPKRQLSCSRTALSFMVQIPLQRNPGNWVQCNYLNGKAGLETCQGVYYWQAWPPVLAVTHKAQLLLMVRKLPLWAVTCRGGRKPHFIAWPSWFALLNMKWQRKGLYPEDRDGRPLGLEGTLKVTSTDTGMCSWNLRVLCLVTDTSMLWVAQVPSVSDPSGRYS